MTPFGAPKKPLTLTEGRLGLTHRRPNFPPTGTHPSPRSASVWRSTTRSILLSLTSRRTPRTLWSLMGNTATPHWVVTSGCRWLVLMPHCSGTVKRKGSTQSVPWVIVPKQESVFSATIKQIAMNVTPDWGLGAEGTTMKQIHVEIWITTKKKDWASRQWGISWCSENNAPLHIFERVVGICYTQSFQRKLIVTMMSRSKLSYRQTLYTERPNVFFCRGMWTDNQWGSCLSCLTKNIIERCV